MSDWVGTTLGVLLVSLSIILALVGIADSFRRRKFTRHNAARIMCGFGFLIFASPDVFYRTLPSDAKEAISWFGAFVIFLSIAIESFDWFSKKTEKSRERLQG